MTSARRVRPIHRLATLIVLVALISLTGAGFLVTRGAAQSAERRLLHKHAAEVAAFLTSSITTLKSSFGLLGETYAARRVDDAGFRAGERSLVQGPGMTVGLAETVGETRRRSLLARTVPARCDPTDGGARRACS